MGSLITKILVNSEVKFGNKKGRHGVSICRLNFLEINKEVRKFKATIFFKGRTVRSMIKLESCFRSRSCFVGIGSAIIRLIKRKKEGQVDE